MTFASSKAVVEDTADGSEPADPFNPLVATLSHLEDSAVVFSADGELALWNAGAETLFGYTFEEARRKDISFLAPPEDSVDTIKLFARALSGQPVPPRLVDRMHKDSHRVRISLRVSPLRNPDGSVFGMLFLGRDMVPEVERENRLTELQLREREIATLVGPGDGVALRFADRRNDHEVELAMVIGQGGSDIARADALSHVAAYAIGLDMTVRGTEDRSLRKGIDGYSVLGPWLVTADEIPDPDSLEFELRVNDVVRQKSNTDQLIFDCARLIEYASSFMTLYPGDIIMTGTLEGVGPVEPGDVMQASITGIGAMSVAVRAHSVLVRLDLLVTGRSILVPTTGTR